MSTVYVSEPPTKGKVVVKTTYGPLDIELWPKEAPKAVRNFIQLCLEGYYDNTIFHRIIKSFLVQGGDPTGTGTGGESIYGNVFADEFHTRLRFNHRGIVACANAGSPHSNGSQFFITLDRCDWLDRKHTIFGKVTGDSLYNLLPLGEVETDKNDRPLDPPPKIISVEVLWNPFDDVIPRSIPSKSLPPSVHTDSKASERKGVKKLNLLSFGEEAEEEEKELTTIKTKIKSSHDVLNDPRLLKEHPSTDNIVNEKTRDVQLSVREALSSKRDELPKEPETHFSKSLDYSDDDDEASFDVKMRLKILNKRKELGENPIEQRSRSESSRLKHQEKSSPDPRSKAESSDDERKEPKLYLKKKGIGSEARAEIMAKADVDLQLLDEAERKRQLKKQKKRRQQGHEEETLAKLGRFMKSLSGKPAEPKEKKEATRDEDLSGWTGVTLKFAPEHNKDKMTRNEDINDYVVLDPLLEKGKEKFNKMQAKQKRREREWAGKSLT